MIWEYFLVQYHQHCRMKNLAVGRTAGWSFMKFEANKHELVWPDWNTSIIRWVHDNSDKKCERVCVQHHVGAMTRKLKCGRVKRRTRKPKVYLCFFVHKLRTLCTSSLDTENSRLLRFTWIQHRSQQLKTIPMIPQCLRTQTLVVTEQPPQKQQSRDVLWHLDPESMREN